MDESCLRAYSITGPADWSILWTYLDLYQNIVEKKYWFENKNLSFNTSVKWAWKTPCFKEQNIKDTCAVVLNFIAIANDY